MWRSIVVYNGEKITISQSQLIVESNDYKNQIPLEDLNCIVIDNLRTSISTYTLSMLSKYDIALLSCDETHMPISLTLPINSNYHIYKVFKMQMELSDSFKNKLWQYIIQCKILNQARVLEYVDGYEDKVNRLIELSGEVLEGDRGNREGIAAKLFFRNLYGANFIRKEDDAINTALNYGYAIFRSSIAKTLASYGFQTFIGIHHISETNSFNLADDFMEPFRPLVDYFVVSNIDCIQLPLDRSVKNGLINLLNVHVEMNTYTVKVRYAIDMMIKSFYTSIERNDTDKLSLPLICKIEL